LREVKRAEGLGLSPILRGFLHFREETQCFGIRVLLLVREHQAAQQDSLDAVVRARE
jgi:hypothetical protein